MRCGNCHHTWHQMPERGQHEGTMGFPRTMSAIVSEESDSPPKPKDIDSDVARVLREEAEREIKARLADAESAPTAHGSNKDRSEIDPETSVAMPEPTESGPAPHDEPNNQTKSAGPNRNLMIPILVVVVLSALGALFVYSFAPQIVQHLPQIEPRITAYVESANELRARINELIETAINAAADLLERES